ncbi:MAG: response regulator transcription factor [Alphaproteobacteria bacterium]|nr:response regulator transcription factor [Alphaproteobacteria bacterium]
MNGSWQHKPHILVVDDDDRLRRLLKRFLGEQEFIVTVAESAEAARRLCRWFAFDLIILDVMMPQQTGIDWMRQEKIANPVLMLSALGEAGDRIEGLEVGAEDYLSKPFEPKELVLRIRAILRRYLEQRERRQWLGFGDYRFDVVSGQLRRGEALIGLTGSETELLRVLAANASKPVAREALAKLLPEGSNERSVDVQMSRLRKKIESSEGRTSYIQTVRGAGYVLYVD